MGNALHVCAHRFREEYQVAGARLVPADIRAERIQPFCTQPPGIIDPRLAEYPAHEAGAVKPGGRLAAAVYIRIADVLFRFHHQRQKVFVRPEQRFRDGVAHQLVFRLDPCNFHIAFALRGDDGNIRFQRRIFGAVRHLTDNHRGYCFFCPRRNQHRQQNQHQHRKQHLLGNIHCFPCGNRTVHVSLHIVLLSNVDKIGRKKGAHALDSPKITDRASARTNESDFSSKHRSNSRNQWDFRSGSSYHCRHKCRSA